MSKHEARTHCNSSNQFVAPTLGPTGRLIQRNLGLQYAPSRDYVYFSTSSPKQDREFENFAIMERYYYE